MELYSIRRERSFRATAFNSSLFIILVFFLFACNSANQNVKKAAEFKVVKTTLAKGIDESDDKDILLSPTKTFTTKDHVVIAHIEFENISGKHKVQWKWYNPDGNLYKAGSYKIGTSKKKYVEKATAWHKIAVKGELAQNYPGEWRVDIYCDGNVVSSKDFFINPISYSYAVNVDEDIPISSTRNPNGFAVVIGNANYHHQDIPDVEYALNDAEVMRRHVINILGYKEGNVIFVSDATKAKFEALFGIAGNHQGLLNDYVKPNVSEIFIYYSGHGAPDTKKMKGYFVPVDSDPAKISLNCYSLDLFYKNISKIEAKKTTVVLDACFSGGTSTGKYLIGNASPALIKIDVAPIATRSAVILTSSDSDQISSWYDETNHGLFTYFFLLGIRGTADLNKDGNITYQELYDFVSDRSEGVPYWARRLHGGRTQTPMMFGNRNQDIFIKL